MIEIKNEYTAGKHKVLVLSDNIPIRPFKNVEIDGKKYVPEVVYGVENEIGVESDKSLVGKVIKFV